MRFQKILFCISRQFKCKSVLFDPSISGATTPSQNGPGSNDNEEVLCIPQSSSISEASHYHNMTLFRGISLLCRDAVRVFCSPSRMVSTHLNLRLSNHTQSELIQKVTAFWIPRCYQLQLVLSTFWIALFTCIYALQTSTYHNIENIAHPSTLWEHLLDRCIGCFSGWYRS